MMAAIIGLIACGGGDTGQVETPDACQIPAEEAEDCNLGDVLIQSESDLEELCQTPCERADRVRFHSLPNIERLEGLDFIQEIDGQLQISHLSNLVEVSMMSELREVGSIAINGNFALEVIEPWEHITEVEGLSFTDARSLRSVDIVPNLERIEDEEDSAGIGLTHAHHIEDLSAFRNVEHLDRLGLEFNDGLESLEGLDSLETVTTVFKLDHNHNMDSLEGAPNLSVVGTGNETWSGGLAQFKRLPEMTECEINEFIEDLDNDPLEVKIEDVSDEDC